MASFAEESRISLPHAFGGPGWDGRKQRWKAVQIFTEYVLLPPNSCICNRVGKLIEVDARGYQFSSKDLQKLQKDHPHLLVQWVDCETLCFHRPSSSSTDLASKFDGQINCYLMRHNRTTEIDIRPSSSLFKATARSAQGKNICADLTIFERTGYRQKLAAARAKGRTIPEGVRVYATIEVQSISQTEDVIRDACMKEAQYMECISIAVLVKTGCVEIYSATQRLFSMYNPLYIDVGSFCPQLQGLRLYMDPLRHAGGWDYPKHPNSYAHEYNSAGALPTLVAAIQADNFELAENIVNYVESLNDERPLLEAVQKATQQVPAARAFVQYLLSNGAQPSQDMQCISAILVATAAKDQPMADLLQRNGAPSPDLSPDRLVAAVRKEDLEFVTLLIQAGADPNQPSVNGQLALVEAAHRSMGLVEAIVNTAGHVDFRKKDCRGFSAFSAAKRMNEREIVQFLEKKEGRGRSGMWGIIKDIFFKREGRRL